MTGREQLRITLRVLRGCQQRVLDIMLALAEADVDSLETAELYDAYDRVIDSLAQMEGRPESQELLDRPGKANQN